MSERREAGSETRESVTRKEEGVLACSLCVHSWDTGIQPLLLFFFFFREESESERGKRESEVRERRLAK